MTTDDEAIGRNLRKLRKGLKGDTSQDYIAELMRDRGFKWSQSTVWAVEKGERPLRLSEARALVSALGAYLFDLTGDDLQTTISKYMRDASEAFKTIEEATNDYLIAQAGLRDLIEVSSPDAWAGMLPIAQNYIDRQAEEAVADARKKFAENSARTAALWSGAELPQDG